MKLLWSISNRAMVIVTVLMLVMMMVVVMIMAVILAMAIVNCWRVMVDGNESLV